METKNTKNIIIRFFETNADSGLVRKFSKWLLSKDLEKEKELEMYEIWSNIDTFATVDTYNDLEKIHTRIEKFKSNRIWTFRVIRSAAAVLLILAGSLLTFLTTNNNSEIVLQECYVPHGERRQLRLPDGSDVWVNAGSLLVYPSEFKGKSRTMYLYGKAEFNVVKNKKMPFIVKTKAINIEALGTVFTVSSYPEDNTITTILKEGSIRITIPGMKDYTTILKPNHLLTYELATNSVSVESVDADKISMWKEGYLIFQGATLAEIFKDIQRRHNVEIYYDISKFSKGKYNIKFLPNETIEENLEVLNSLVDDFEYTYKGKVIYIH